MKEKRKQLNTKQKTFGLFSAIIFLFILFSFVKTAEAQIIFSDTNPNVSAGWGGAGGTQKAGVLVQPNQDLLLTGFSTLTGTTGTPSIAYLQNGTSGGYALGSIIATTSVNQSTGIATFSDAQNLSSGSYYFLVFDDNGFAWSEGIHVYTGTNDTTNFDWVYGWNDTRVLSSVYSVKNIYYSADSNSTSTRISEIIYPVGGNTTESTSVTFEWRTYKGTDGYDKTGIEVIELNTGSTINTNGSFREFTASGYETHEQESLLQSGGQYSWRAVITDNENSLPNIYSAYHSFYVVTAPDPSFGDPLIQIEIESSTWCDLSTTSETWFYQKVNMTMSGICRLAHKLTNLPASVGDSFVDRYESMKSVFPFSLFFSISDILNSPTTPAQQTTYIPFPWSSTTSTGIAISSTTISAVVGSSNLTLWKNTISAFIWIALAFVIFKSI